MENTTQPVDLLRLIKCFKSRVKYLDRELKHIEVAGVRAAKAQVKHLDNQPTLTTSDSKFLNRIYQLDDVLTRGKRNHSVDSLNLLKQIVKDIDSQTSRWNELRIAIYSYWQLQRIRNKSKALLPLLKMVPMKPTLLLSVERNQQQAMLKKEKRTALDRLLHGEVSDSLLIHLNGEFDGFGLTENKKKQLRDYALIHRLVDGYQRGERSLSDIVIRLERALPIISSNKILLRSIDNLLSNMAIHFKETSFPDTGDIAQPLPQFTKKINTQIETQRQKALNEAQVQLSVLMASPWPWCVLPQVIASIPHDSSFDIIKEYLDYFAEILSQKKHDVRWLNSLATNLQKLKQAIAEQHIRVTIHSDISSLIHVFPISNALPDLDKALQQLENDHHATIITETLHQLLVRIMKETAYQMIREDLLMVKLPQEFPATLIQRFEDLQIVNNIQQECLATPHGEPASLHRLAHADNPLWQKLDTTLQSRVRLLLSQQFSEVLAHCSPDELLGGFRWVDRHEYEEIIVDDKIKRWIALASQVSAVFKASSTEMQMECIGDLLRSVNTAGVKVLPKHWVDSALADLIFTWFEQESPMHVGEHAAILGACYAKLKRTKRGKMNQRFIQFATADGTRQQQVDALIEWQEQIAAVDGESELNCIIALLTGSSAVMHLQQLDHPSWRRLAKMIIAERPFTDWFHDSIAACKNVSQFMLMVEGGNIIDSPISTKEIPAAIIHSNLSNLKKVWHAVERCQKNKGQSLLETSLRSLREIHALDMTRDEKKFLTWYIEEGNLAQDQATLKELLDALLLLHGCDLTEQERGLLFPDRPLPVTSNTNVPTVEQSLESLLKLLEKRKHLEQNHILDGLLNYLGKGPFSDISAYIKVFKKWNDTTEACLSDIANELKGEVATSLNSLMEERKSKFSSSDITMLLPSRVLEKEQKNIEHDRRLTDFINNLVSMLNEYRDIKHNRSVTKIESVNLFNGKIEHCVAILNTIHLEAEINKSLIQQVDGLRF